MYTLHVTCGLKPIDYLLNVNYNFKVINIILISFSSIWREFHKIKRSWYQTFLSCFDFSFEIFKKIFCGLQLLRELHRPTRLTQLTGRRQHYAPLSSYPIILTRLGGPSSRPNPHLKLLKCRNRIRDHMISSQTRWPPRPTRGLLFDIWKL